MKIKLKSLSDKVTAIVLYLLCMTLVISMYLEISYMADYGFYDRSKGDSYPFMALMSEKVEKESEDIKEYVLLSIEQEYHGISEDDTRYYTYSSLCDKYKKEASNLIIVAQSGDGKLNVSNLESDENLAEIETCFESEKRTSFFDETTNETYPVTIKIYVRKNFTADDIFSLTSAIIKIAQIIKYPTIIIMIAFAIIAMLILAVLMVNINYTPNKMRFIDKIPFDLFTVLTIVFIGFVVSMIVLMSADKTRENEIVLWNGACAILAFFVFCAILVYFLSLAVRIKAGHIFKSTLIYKLLARIHQGKSKDKSKGYFKMPFVGKLIITVGFVLVLDLGLIMFNYLRFLSKGTEYNFSVFALIQVSMAFAVGTLLFMIAINFNRLRESGKKLANGDYGENLDSRVMFGDFKAINDSFIALKEDMIKTLEEKNETEKMRSELIANISHDIKTPLTSIINYTDIIGSGKCSEAELNEYYEVINKQSKRLTTLLQNLIDVSQITSGSVKIKLDKLNLDVFVSQVLDELSQKLAEKELTFEKNLPDEDIFIIADGQKLWRIFENLISNVGKYAMPGTRVYLTVEETDAGRVMLELKNISEKKIESSPEKLLERFTRDDTARQSDGNGLGLSIIKNLTELQGGEFQIAIDGDLFKAMLFFDKAKDDEDIIEE